MESNKITQTETTKIIIDEDTSYISLLQNTPHRHMIDVIVIERGSLPDLIAALQSFLPKETE